MARPVRRRRICFEPKYDSFAPCGVKSREKIADCLVGGKTLCISGGNYALCDGSAWRCCGRKCDRARAAAGSGQAVDFDEFPGEGRSFHGCCHGAKPYRKHTSMEMHPAGEKAFAFDCGWDRYGLALGPDEFAVYSFSGAGGKIAVEVTFADGSDGEAEGLFWIRSW